MTDWDFIIETAPTLRFKDREGVEYEAYRKWPRNGVPYWARLPLLEAAEAAGFPLDKAAFDNPPGRFPQKADAA